MTVTPPPCNGAVIVGVVEAFARHWPHLKPPMFRADDVLPLLAGNDREYNAASALLEAERVHYQPGQEPD
ncbi:hypothetical protein [Nocardia xishanensis]|uniref:hypothetical protein n=1 Tax=Nocardia xishanensis TaxID=238964 RepID=UPI000A9F8AF0|nr:hypothetical protein [Nocardia xishanensis]